MSWENKVLSDISISIQTGPFGSQLHQSDYSETGTPVVMPKDLINGKISEESIARVSQDHVDRLSKHKICAGDILRTGCLKVTIDTNKAIPSFVFYQLQKAEIVGWVVNHAVGSTMLNLNTSILSSVPIELPEMEIQRKIVDYISAYDALIENNQKQIKLLEEAAQRLYKEWFIDLRFPGYEDVEIVDGVPEGWLIKPFSDVFEFVRGKSYSTKELSEKDGTLMVNLKNIRAFGGYNRGAEKRFIGNVAMIPECNEDLTFSMDLIKLLPISVTRNYLYCAMQYGGYSDKISPLANGVNVLHLKPDSIMNMEMLVPDFGMLSIFDSAFEPIRMKIDTLQKQCIFAMEARDRLLPKLMNGLIEI